VTAATIPPFAMIAAAALRDGQAAPALDPTVATSDFLDWCRGEDLLPLLDAANRAKRLGGWPRDLRESLTAAAPGYAAREMVARTAIDAALAALRERGVRPVLFKGTALAYSAYRHPHLRPRNDTDLLIDRRDVDRVRATLGAAGYAEPNYCDGELVFCQFELQKTDLLALPIALDFHWKISTQAAFADLFTYEELHATSVPAPALSPHARVAGGAEALILACIHPAMHHRNELRLLWVHDVHLLYSGLSDAERARFEDLALTRAVAAVCAHQLRLARELLGTPVEDAVLARLNRPRGEATAVYLDGSRRWRDELASNLGTLSGWRSRLRLLREVAFPRPGYVLAKYGVRSTTAGWLLLPALYAGRLAWGSWKIVTGRK
jgi:Uncharacterised nucleotidyltransferase